MTTLPSPTLTQILSSIQSDINSRLTGADSTLTASVLNVLANVLAGVAFNEYGFIDFVAQQIFPDTATSEFLRRWGAIWGVVPIPANPASGYVTCTGTNGVTIPAGTVFQRADTALFTSTADATISGGTAAVPVTANVAGANSNTGNGATMTFVSPISFIANTGVVDSNGLVGGADAEADAPYEARVLQRIQKPPQGGDANDYVEWALQVPNVTRAWCYPQELGVGTVSVRFMMDNTYTDGIPHSGDVTAVSNYITTLKPVTADLTVVAPTPDVLNFTIHLNVADSSAIRAAVQANLEEMITRDAIPAGTIYLSRINEAISLATGEFDHVLSNPNADVTHATGHIATMGTITWT